jgi:hypothetical protein
VVPGLLLWTLAHAYLAWRAASVPRLARHIPRWSLIAVVAALWASFLVPRSFERAGGVFGGALEWVAMNWLGVLFLLLISMLAAEIATGFGVLVRRHAGRVRGWALLAGAALSAVAFVQGFRAPAIRDYEVRIAGLPADQDGTVVAVIADLHLGSMLGERWLAARIAQVQALHPDLIVALGDIVEGHGGPEGALLAELRHLSAPLGV